MKKIHIVLLVSIAAVIAVLISFMGTLTTYDTVETAKKKLGQFVHLIAKLDKTVPVEAHPALEVSSQETTSLLASELSE